MAGNVPAWPSGVENIALGQGLGSGSAAASPAVLDALVQDEKPWTHTMNSGGAPKSLN
ncbi:MAG: hypothetical protein H8E20_13625 [Verrucomicrobia bacterium]|nr:hypothetical protein [Verrucomicrobiota bacterium]